MGDARSELGLSNAFLNRNWDIDSVMIDGSAFYHMTEIDLTVTVRSTRTTV